MFLGEYQHSLDDKGRFTVPSKFREELGGKFIATRGLDDCIFLYPLQEWENIGKELHSLSFTKADARAFVRLFFSGASELELDKQGRTILPNNLREYASINKDLQIIGVGSRVEIWSNNKWQEYNKKASSSYEEIAESLIDLGI